jgi:hypothetical protein
VNARHYPYVYGGGHGGFHGPFDCSGAVSYVLHAGGKLSSPVSTDYLKSYGAAGDGGLVTVGVRGSTGRNAHTMMRLGSKYFESGSGHGAAWTGGWSGGFPIHRHPAGMSTGGILGTLAQLLSPGRVGWGLSTGGALPFLGSYHSGGVAPMEGYAHVLKGERMTPEGSDSAMRALKDSIDRLIETGYPDALDALTESISERQGYGATRGRRLTAGDGRMAIP